MGNFVTKLGSLWIKVLSNDSQLDTIFTKEVSMSVSKFIFPSLLLLLIHSSSAWAYLSFAESAEIMPAGRYQVGFEPQLLTNRGNGANFNLFFDANVNDDTSARVTMGAGAIDFNAFASVKYIPFPDVGNQPAMGLRAGAGVSRDEGENLLTAQLAPMLSKKFNTEYGMSVPYLAIPFNFVNSKEENYVGSNVVFGTEFHSKDAQNFIFGAEIGAELSKSYSYISAFITIPFDSSKGFGK